MSAAGPALRYAGTTDIGQVRTHNEDALVMTPSVLAVADGMGGHAAGEVASRIAVDTLGRVVRGKAALKNPEQALREAIREANQIILERAGEYEQFAGMGTTVTAAVLTGSLLTIAHVGDSRAYLLRDGRLQQITEDHSLVQELLREGRLSVQEAAVHPQRSVITRALGTAEDVEIDIVRRELEPGDRLLLCTDGLVSVLPDSMIARTLEHDAPLADLCSRLVAQANIRGGPDNITLVVAEYLGGEEELKTKRRRVWPAILTVSAAFLLVAGIAAAAASAYLGNSYYLAWDGDTVAIYQGLPGNVLGVKLAKVYRDTSIRREELPGYFQERLDAGIRLTDAADADRVISEIVLSRQPQQP